MSTTPNSSRSVVVISVTVVLVVVIGAVTLATIRDGNTERLVIFLGAVIPALPAIYALNKVTEVAQQTQRVQEDVTQVKHATNGQMTRTITEAVHQAVATTSTEDPRKSEDA